MINILEKVSEKLHQKKMLLVSAESCTGGWLAKQITDLAGSSAIFERGFVTYSNQSKHEMIGVKNSTLETYGAVSENVVKEMAQGALENSHADVSIAISGVAGPDGGSEEKPVGMVCFGFMLRNRVAIAKTKVFAGNRDEIRTQAVDYALAEIYRMINVK